MIDQQSDDMNVLSAIETGHFNTRNQFDTGTGCGVDCLRYSRYRIMICQGDSRQPPCFGKLDQLTGRTGSV